MKSQTPCNICSRVLTAIPLFTSSVPKLCVEVLVHGARAFAQDNSVLTTIPIGRRVRVFNPGAGIDWFYFNGVGSTLPLFRHCAQSQLSPHVVSTEVPSTSKHVRPAPLLVPGEGKPLKPEEDAKKLVRIYTASF